MHMSHPQGCVLLYNCSLLAANMVHWCMCVFLNTIPFSTYPLIVKKWLELVRVLNN